MVHQRFGLASAGNANRGTTFSLAILTGRHAAHWEAGVLRIKFEVHTYFFPNFFMPRSELVQAWIEESLKYPPKEPGGAGALRIVQYKDKYYFVDERCRQLRNVEDFMDQIKFATAGEMLSFKLNECQQIT